MDNYAIIENGIVTNVIVWNGDTMSWLPGPGQSVYRIIDGIDVAIGYSYDAETHPFTPPEAPPATEPEAPTVPTSVSMKQARLALLAAGKYADVQKAIAAVPGDAGDAARIEWEFSATVDRDSDLVRSLSASLGLDDAALDALFTAAAAL